MSPDDEEPAEDSFKIRKPSVGEGHDGEAYRRGRPIEHTTHCERSPTTDIPVDVSPTDSRNCIDCSLFACQPSSYPDSASAFRIAFEWWTRILAQLLISFYLVDPLLPRSSLSLSISQSGLLMQMRRSVESNFAKDAIQACRVHQSPVRPSLSPREVLGVYRNCMLIRSVPIRNTVWLLQLERVSCAHTAKGYLEHMASFSVWLEAKERLLIANSQGSHSHICEYILCLDLPWTFHANNVCGQFEVQLEGSFRFKTLPVGDLHCK